MIQENQGQNRAKLRHRVRWSEWQAQAQGVYESAALAVADGFTRSAVILAVLTQFKSLSCLNGLNH